VTSPSLLLLDTHVFLWWRMNSSDIRQDVADIVANAEIVFVSVASAWEAAIKAALGKLHIPASFEQGVRDSGFTQLSIAFSHAEDSARLPLHHKDPFDRMLIAQARAEGLTLVTNDDTFASYDVALLRT
jgi:PIN domain nuclease of toxin-antitoxin system